MKKTIMVFLIAVVFGTLVSLVSFAQSSSAKLLSSHYDVTYSNEAYSGNNTISNVPPNEYINTFLYNLRKENPDLIINIFTHTDAVPEFYNYISDYNDRRMYLEVKEKNTDEPEIFYIVPKIASSFEDDFESYPLGRFVNNDSWRFNIYRTNAGYTAICEEDGNRYLSQIVPAAGDADYEENTATSTYTVEPCHLKVEKGDIVELKFRLRRNGGSMYLQLRDSSTSSTGHVQRIVHTLSSTLTVFYSTWKVTDSNNDPVTFSDGQWIDFRIVFDRRSYDDSENYISIYLNNSTQPLSRKLCFASLPDFVWEDFRACFGFSPSDINNTRAVFDIDDYSFTTNGEISTEDTVSVYSKSPSDGFEASGAVIDGNNEIKLSTHLSAGDKVKILAASKTDGILTSVDVSEVEVLQNGKVYLPLELYVENAGKSKVELYLWDKTGLKPIKNTFNIKISDVSRAIDNGHPRIVATADDFEKIRSYTDSTHTQWKNTVIEYADEICEGFSTTNTKSSFYIGDDEVFSTVANRIKEFGTVLGMAYQLTLDKKYSEKMYEAVVAAGNLSGFTDGTVTNLTVSYFVEGFSLCYDWCYDAYTEEQRNTIGEIAVEHCLWFALDEYYNRERGSHTWSTTYTNHNSIPNANFITASIAFADHAPQICETVLYYSKDRIKNYLAGLAPDGGWWEGEMYTNLVFAHLAKASESMRINFGCDELIAGTSFVSRSPDFHMAVKGPLGTYNFAELLNPNPYCMVEMLWLANAYNRKDVRSWALENINFNSAKNCSLALIWVPDLADTEPWEFKNQYVRGIEHVTLGNGSAGNASWLSILGGVNMGSHKHLDLGSFIYDYNGVRWAVELGLNNYYKGYHSETSKTKIYYRSRSEGHNTLVINPTSADGGQRMNDSNGISKGEVISYNLRSDKPYAVYDLSTAYSDKANSVKRGFRLLDNNIGFIVRDEFATKTDDDNGTDDEVYWFMHTYASIEISSDGKTAILTQDGKSMKVQVFEEELEITIADAITPEPIRSELLAYSEANGLELYKQDWNGYKEGDTDTSNDKKKLQIKHTGSGNGTITVMVSPVETDAPSDIFLELANWN